MNWGDELCGVKVTPEAWAGGIVATKDTGHWAVIVNTSPNQCDGMREFGLPIFPPRGWAGKTDAELWAAAIPIVLGPDLPDDVELCLLGNGQVYLSAGGDAGPLNGFANITDNMPALILALQNAQVLARRLQP